MRNLVKERPQHPAAEGQHRDQRQQAFRHRARYAGGAKCAATARQRGRQRQQRHKRQILEQQHREGQPPVRAVEFGLIGKLLQHDCRGAHGDSTAQHRGRYPIDRTGAQQQCHRHAHSQELSRAQTKHFAAHGHHARPQEI